MEIKSQLFTPLDDPSSAGAATLELPQVPQFPVSSGFELHVLLVEPARDEREMYVEHLCDHGMRVTCATSLGQTIELARSAHPHVIVIEPCWQHSTDLGLTIIRALRLDSRTTSIPIVAVSGHAFAHERAAALEAGCECFLEKPCAPARLSSELERLSWRYRLQRSRERRRACQN
ncbi:MAG TPA: response regulator [Vicinamibacterales bacterium]|nr:response regulator [Vicinamibacterales bacterium]